MLKCPLNAPDNSTVKPTIVVVVLILSLHPSSLLLLPLPITSAGTIIGSPCDNLWLLGLIICEYLAADCKAFSLARKGRQ
jgi:hypothetical protein